MILPIIRGRDLGPLLLFAAFGAIVACSCSRVFWFCGRAGLVRIVFFGFSNGFLVLGGVVVPPGRGSAVVLQGVS